MAVGDDDSMNFTPPGIKTEIHFRIEEAIVEYPPALLAGSYDQNPKDRTVVAFRDAFVALKPQLLNDVHRVKFSWYVA